MVKMVWACGWRVGCVPPVTIAKIMNMVKVVKMVWACGGGGVGTLSETGENCENSLGLSLGCGVCTNGENGLGLWLQCRVCTSRENGENGLGMWLGCGVGTPSENCENCENGFVMWLGCGVGTPVKIVMVKKIVKKVRACVWGVGWLPGMKMVKIVNIVEIVKIVWSFGFGVWWVSKIVKIAKIVWAYGWGMGYVPPTENCGNGENGLDL